MPLIARCRYRLSVCRRLFTACGLIGLGLVLLAAPSQTSAAELSATLATSPPASEIRPDFDLVKVTVEVMLDSEPLPAGHLQVTVTAPPSPPLLSTDFPIVEGTRLLTLNSDLQAGAWSFDYLFPIRGTYTFDLKVSPVSGGPSFAATALPQRLHLPENPGEVRNIWLLVAVLFLLGGVGGVIFARSAAAREGLHAAVLMALVLSGLLLPGQKGVSHAAESAAATHRAEGEGGWTLAVQATPPEGKVGELVRFDITLSRTGASPAAADDAEIKLVMHHIEDDKAVFETTVYTHQGEATEQFQFFDGAPHRVMVMAQPGGDSAVEPLQVEFDMEVEGLHPPMAVKVRTLALLLGVMVVGMAVGFFLPIRRES